MDKQQTNKENVQTNSECRRYFALLKEYWADLVKVNILFFVSSLPVITAPAAITAMCYIVMRMLRSEDYHLVKDFFACVKREFAPSLVLGLIGFAGLVAAAYSFVQYGWHDGEDWLYVLPSALSILFFFNFFLFASYSFPMLALLDLKLPQIIKNTFLLLFIHIKENFLAVASFLIYTGLIIISFPFTLPLIFVIYFSLCCFTVSFCVEKGINECAK